MAPRRESILAKTALLAAGLVALTARATPDPAVQRGVDNVSEARAGQVVADLAAFGTRNTGTAGNDAAAQYLFDALAAAGYSPAFEPFPYGALTLRNVSARKPGLVRPSEVWIVVAHYDSTSERPDTLAPGADDDASGVAAVIETARALAGSRHEATLEFLLTAGEEQGLLGSEFDSSRAVLDGENIAGVINHDMIAWWPTGWLRDLDVNGGTPASHFLVTAYARAAADYVPGMPVDPRDDWGVCGDDQVPYEQRGYPAIIVMDCREAHLGEDGESTPHYHQSSDTLATCDIPRMTEVIRATTATASTLAVPIVRGLLRNDALTSRTNAAGVLRPGDDAGGALTRIDPAHAATTIRWNPASPATFSSDGEPVGPGASGVLTFYETDAPDAVRVEKRDADSDGALDVVVTF